MAALQGNAAFVWDSTSAGTGVLMLRAPLRAVRTSVRQTMFVHEDLDYSVREVTTSGSGVHELVADMRYEDAPATLAEFLLFGMRGGTITYVPDLTDQQRYWDCYLVEPGGSPGLSEAQASAGLATVDMDGASGSPGHEWLQMEIRLRKTDGTAFE